MARFLLLWGFYLSTPASVGTPRRPWAAHRCQRLSLPVSALPVNRYGAHAMAPRPLLHAVVSSTRLPKLTSEKLSRSDLVQQQLCQYYQSLSEKDRRRFAAVQAITLGHGGIQYIAQVLGCDPQTVQEGMRELKQLPDDPAGQRVRKPGGGRKQTAVKHAALMQQVQDTMKDRTAVDPMREDVVWTDGTPQEIPDSLQAQAVSVGPRLVRRMLATLGFARRQMAKVLPGGDSPHRDAPCRHVSHLIQEFLEAGNPVLRIDTKKKECLGTLYRDGKVYCQQALPVFDHDCPSLARGVIMPQGIDDLA
jgi:hypothetical protein